METKPLFPTGSLFLLLSTEVVCVSPMLPQQMRPTRLQASELHSRICFKSLRFFLGCLPLRLFVAVSYLFCASFFVSKAQYPLGHREKL